MNTLIILLILFIVSGGLLYLLYSKNPGKPFLLPGDFYRVKNTRAIYIPISSTLILTAFLALILKLLRIRI
ncbi:DUF2905 family protein [Patescibacteria group bacterium]|nr:DUF2905 family protein [Patescibacteria group bacterium]